jgi:hypothetical protein
MHVSLSCYETQNVDPSDIYTSEYNMELMKLVVLKSLVKGINSKLMNKTGFDAKV